MSPAEAWSGLVAWVDEREPVTWLALFRIAIATIVAFTLLDMWRSGAFSLLWLPPEAGGIAPLEGDFRIAALGGPSAAVCTGLFAAALAACAALAAGVGSRAGALLAGQCLLALFSLAPGTGGGHDRLITNALWLLVLAPADGSLSLACRWRTGRWLDPTPRPAWPRRLLAWQLVVTYTITGVQKLAPEWWPWGGLDAVYRALLQPSWARHDLSSLLPSVFPVTQAMTAASVVWEGGFCVILLWWLARRRGWRMGQWPVRAVLLVTGLVMHGILWATSNLGPFPFVTVAYYLSCFDQSDWARLTAGTARLRSPPP